MIGRYSELVRELIASERFLARLHKRTKLNPLAEVAPGPRSARSLRWRGYPGWFQPAAIGAAVAAAAATEVPRNAGRKEEILDLRHRFWFGLPQQLQPGDVDRLKAAGALILPAINTFRYPEEEHMKLANDDIERLTKQGVDGFQIDSVYFEHLTTY